MKFGCRVLLSRVQDLELFAGFFLWVSTSQTSIKHSCTFKPRLWTSPVSVSLSVCLSVCPSVHLNVCLSVAIIWYICVRMFAVCAWMRYMCTGLITADAIRNVRWHEPLCSSFSVNSLRLAQAPLFRSNATLWGFASIGFDSFPVEPRMPIMTYC